MIFSLASPALGHGMGPRTWGISYEYNESFKALLEHRRWLSIFRLNEVGT
jgi:hypothetical protein